MFSRDATVMSNPPQGTFIRWAITLEFIILFCGGVDNLEKTRRGNCYELPRLTAYGGYVVCRPSLSVLFASRSIERYDLAMPRVPTTVGYFSFQTISVDH